MALHEQLRTLVAAHGPSILETAEGFRAALDDFLTEEEATAGELNLLVDAVRLGALQRMVALLDQGAEPKAALTEAAAQLARDRDSAPDRARWALAMLGYASERLDATIPAVEPEGPPPTDPESTVTAASPAPPPVPSSEEPPSSPPLRAVPATEQAAHEAPAGPAAAAPAPRPRALRVGLTVAGALVLVVAGVVAAVAWPEGDDDDSGLRSGGQASEVGGEANEGGVGDSGTCPAPSSPPVDEQADEAARCLAGQFDAWADASLMAVGQQVNLDDDKWTRPLTSLAPADAKVVGFDFEELANAAALGKDRVPDLVTLAEQGHVLTATWHADNPWTGEFSNDTTDKDRVSELLRPDDPSDPAYTKFWGDWDDAIDEIGRFRDAGVALIVRPLHEANGDWFWWGQLDPELYQELWSEMRNRVEAAGLHNVLWHYAAAPKTWEGIQDPLELLPTGEIDFAGIDTYDCEQPGNRAELLECGGRADYSDDHVELASYADLEAAAPRMTLSEVGPQFSFDGSWDPSIVTESVIAEGFTPVYAMFWFDDQREGRPPMSKQLASLQGGPEWLAGCSEALCSVAGS